jgi:hypothetical protein
MNCRPAGPAHRGPQGWLGHSGGLQMAAVSAHDLRRFSGNLGTGNDHRAEATGVNLFAAIGAEQDRGALVVSYRIGLRLSAGILALRLLLFLPASCELSSSFVSQ